MFKNIHLFVLTSLFMAGMSFEHYANAQQRVALSLPLSGPSAKLALQYETGARLALEAYNKQADSPVELIIADDGCDENVARLAVDEIKAAEPQIITGLLCNAVAIYFADSFAQTDIPLLVAGAQSERLIKDRERNDWNLWRLSPGDSEAAQAAVDHFSTVWSQEPYAIVDDGTVYGRNLADNFRAGMEALGLPPQFQDNFRPTQSTQARMVRRLRRAGATHAFIGASAEDAAMIARNAEELGIPIVFGSGEALSIFPFLDPVFLPKGGITAVLRHAEVEPEIPATLKDALAEMDLQAEPYVLGGYQAMEVALQALGEDGKTTADNLGNLRFKTLLGDVQFGVDGNNTASQFSPYHWNVDRFERITE